MSDTIVLTANTNPPAATTTTGRLPVNVGAEPRPATEVDFSSGPPRTPVVLLDADDGNPEITCTGWPAASVLSASLRNDVLSPMKMDTEGANQTRTQSR